MTMKFKTLIFSTKAIDPDAGLYEVLASSEAEDRDNDILLAAGAQLENFRKNPVVLYAHNYSGLPVARAPSIEAIPGTGLKAQIQFPAKGIYDIADSVHGLWAGQFLNAASVGFIPKKAEVRPGPNGEMPKDKWEEWGWPYGKIYTSWELLEFSIVPVPANADALRLSFDPFPFGPLGKRGRVLSAANEQKLRSAYESIGAVLAQLGDQPDEDSELSELAASLAELSAFYGVN